MADTVTIRSATAADAHAIGAVFDAAVRAAWTYLGELAQTPMFPPEEWDKEVADHAPPNAMLVAVDAWGAIVGFVAVHPAEGELFLLFVHPEAAGRGIGRRLFAKACGVLRASGHRTGSLTTEPGSRAARFYQAAGWKVMGTSARGERIFEGAL